MAVTVDSEDARILIVGAGRKALLVCVLPRKADQSMAMKKLQELADTFKVL
jgi:predicted regulator of Ras-like GTPase activity (Roadblock/LC7/MglB family)